MGDVKFSHLQQDFLVHARMNGDKVNLKIKSVGFLCIPDAVTIAL